jgi:hypothetical protein
MPRCGANSLPWRFLNYVFWVGRFALYHHMTMNKSDLCRDHQPDA